MSHPLSKSSQLSGWSGNSCNQAICRADCSTIGGFCDLPGECRCSLGFFGPLCDRGWVLCQLHWLLRDTNLFFLFRGHCLEFFIRILSGWCGNVSQLNSFSQPCGQFEFYHLQGSTLVFAPFALSILFSVVGVCCPVHRFSR